MSKIVTLDLLEALLSPLAAPRQEAECHLQSLSVEDCVKGLTSILLENATKEARHVTLVAVLLRRNIILIAGNVLSKTLDQSTAENLLKELVSPLLEIFGASSFARRQFAHCLAEVCSSLSILNQAQCDVAVRVIMEKIAPACSAADPFSLHCLATMCERSPASMVCYLDSILSLIANANNTANDNSSIECLLEAFVSVAVASERKGAAIDLGVNLQKQNELKIDPQSQSARMGKLLLSLFPKLERLDDETKTRCLQSLVYAAGASPSLLAGDLSVFASLVQFCIQTNTLLSLEVLVSLCSVPDIPHKLFPTADGMQIRSMLCQHVLSQCANFMVTSLDEEIIEWAQEPATLLEDTAEEDEDFSYATTLFGRFVIILGNGSLPVLLPLVESFMAAGKNDWRQFCVALTIMQTCLYVGPIMFAPHVTVALEAALELTKTDHARLQHQALLLLGALCESDNAEIGGQRILEAAVRLVPSPCSKVSTTASAVIISYCRAEATVEPYCREVLQVLVTGPLSQQVIYENNQVNYGALASKVRAIGAVACLAEACAEGFRPFYEAIMPGLLATVQTHGSFEEGAQLRGGAMEAITIIGQAIGHSDLYARDAEELMRIALITLKSPTDNQDIPLDQVLSSCARVATVMEEQFTPFLPEILPHILERINAVVDISYEEGNEAGLESTKRGDLEMDDDGNNAMTILIPGKGFTKISIDMSKIEEKSQACRATYELAFALGASFAPYAEEFISALKPLISYAYSPDVRSTACQALAAVFESACKGRVPLVAQTLPVLSNAICEQIASEGDDDMEALYAICESLSDILCSAYEQLSSNDRSVLSNFTIDNGTVIVKLLMGLISSCLERRRVLFETLEGVHGALAGEDEQNELKQKLDMEEEVLNPLINSVGYVLKFLKQDFLPLFEMHVAPILGTFLKGSSDTRAQFAAVALFDDCIEHCGESAAQRFGSILAEGVLVGINPSTNGGDDDVLRTSIYGIAQIARYCPPNTLEPYAQSILLNLMALGKVPKDENQDVHLIENAVSALAALVLIGPAPLGHMKFLNRDDLIATFLKQLPFREDEDEAKICHAGFCDLVIQGDAKDTSEIMRIIGEILVHLEDGEELACQETKVQMTKILFEMQQKVQPHVLRETFGSLSEEAQKLVNVNLQQYAPNPVVTP